jgi:lipoprotein-anchoring transpeptidase ErfK/SrfK
MGRIDDERNSHAAIERLLADSFRSRATSVVSDFGAVPPMTDSLGPDLSHGRRSGRSRTAWIVAASAAVVAAAAAVTVIVTHSSGTTHGAPVGALGTGSAGGTSTAAAPGTSVSSPSTSVSTSSSPRPAPATVVHVTALENDGATYGVGMPIVLYFSPVPTDAKAFEKAATVSVNGAPVDGAWYWEQPTADEVQGHIVEAHYRTKEYWPPNSTIHVATPIAGLSAGKGLAYSGRLTSLDYKIGDAHVSTVDANGLVMHVTSNGRLVNTFKVSLGKAATPTFNGTKIVMQKGEDVPGTNTLRPSGTVMMNGPNYTNDPVQWSVRITRSGEYVHAAPWNNGIGLRSTSNGCTNLHTSDGKWFYDFSQIGDVVEYSNTDGQLMPSWDGLGDWNLRWGQWRQGGLLAPA